jgi:hypothetical protein
VSHVVTAEDGARAVDTLARKKDRSPRADFIKVYSWIPRAAYFAIASESKKLGIPFAGHVPYSVSVLEASNAGQSSLEHETDLMLGCTSKDSVLRARFADTANVNTGRLLAEMRAQAPVILASHDAAKCRGLIAALVRNHTWVTPTLVFYQPYVHDFDSAGTHPEWARYVPGLVQGGWLQRKPAIQPGDSSMIRSYFSFDLTRQLNDAGVKLLAGTDASQPFVYPGFSLHEELQLLVHSGLTPLEALRTATYNPAEYLGALDSLGAVGRGKVADLVLLDANPLSDIRNTRRISAVIANGRLFDSTDRSKLLTGVQAALKH